MPTISDKFKSHSTDEERSVSSKALELEGAQTVSSGPKKDSIFADIDTKNSSQAEKPKKSTLEKKSNILDYIYMALAIGSLLGLLFFYFQGLQPLIVYNYTGNAMTQIDGLSDSFFQKSNAAARSLSAVELKSFYNVAGICKEDENASLDKVDLDTISNLKTIILPDSKLKTVKNFQNIFYLAQVKDIYAKSYKNYTDKLSEIQPMVDDLTVYPAYLDYKNAVVQTCGVISRSGVGSSEIISACNTLATKATEYESKNHPQIWNESKPLSDKLVSSCKEFNNKTAIAQWKLGWFDNFDNFILKNTDFTIQKDKLTGLNKNLQESLVAEKKELDQIYTDRKELKNIWYLVGIQF